jgi:hypothetical protein
MFKLEYWTKYFDNMYDQYDLMYVFNYLDFKKFALNSILGKTQIINNSYYSFEYGADEIWINYVLKKVLTDNKKKDKLYTYLVNDHKIESISLGLSDSLKYNSLKNGPQFKLFMNECKMFNKSNYKDYIDTLKEPSQFINFFKELKSNKFFNRLYIRNNIKYIICNYEELLTKRQKYNYRDLIL